MFSAANTIIYIIALAVTLALLPGDSRRRFLRPEASSFAQIAVGLLLWAGIVAVVGGINVVLFHRFALFQFTSLSPGAMARFLLFQLLVAVTEELLFRGLLTEWGRRLRWHWAAIALVSAALFGAVHWLTQRDLIQLAMATVLGFVFSTVYQRSRRCTVYSLMLAHFLYDIAVSNVTA